MSTHQQAFDTYYITTNELATKYKVTVQLIKHVRDRGHLPEAISVGNGFIYVRSEAVEAMDEYFSTRKVRRGRKVGA